MNMEGGDSREGGEPRRRGAHMHREILEQPRVLRGLLDELAPVSRGEVRPRLHLPSPPGSGSEWPRQVCFIGCGTARHAGMVGAALIRNLARIPAWADTASEFAYADPLVDENTLVVAVSQSGETADTKAALETARRLGARTMAVTNAKDSTIAARADGVIYTRAGKELSVASTKAYTAQLTVMAVLAARLGGHTGNLDPEEKSRLLDALRELPEALEQCLGLEDSVAAAAAEFAGPGGSHMFFVGRGLDWPSAREGQLKLKEVAYIHAEAYPAGELRHGPMALVEEGFPVFALATQPRVKEPMMGIMDAVRSIGGKVIALGYAGDHAVPGRHADAVISIPEVDPRLSPVAAAVPLQFFAYHSGLVRGCPIDNPRHLVKSVKEP